jgi:uncharacterized protein
MPKTVLITGASGLVGQALQTLLLSQGYQVRSLSRKAMPEKQVYGWDLAKKWVDPKALEDVNFIIHLAGDTINQRWTPEAKQSMRDSRIASAQLLLQACQAQGVVLEAFISASGINFYGSTMSEKPLVEEDGQVKRDFLSDLCVDWEAAAYKFQAISQRVVCLRTAVVLAKAGGTYPLLKKLTQWQLASPMASGKQAMNWIHIQDLCQMFLWALAQPLQGSYNAVASPINNHDFMQQMAKKLGKFFLPIPVPAFMLRLLKGEMSEILISGAPTSAQKIMDTGFKFAYYGFDEALTELNK